MIIEGSITVDIAVIGTSAATGSSPLTSLQKLAYSPCGPLVSLLSNVKLLLLV